MRSEVGPADFRHLLKIQRLGRLATALGYLTAWLGPNPISALLLALGQSTRLTLGHHIRHGAYDRIAGVPEHYRSRRFGKGWRRYLDWLEWWENDAWTHLHNTLHHPHMGDEQDADIMRLTEFRRLPRPLRVAALIAVTVSWKYSFYALHLQRALVAHRRGEKPGAMPAAGREGGAGRLILTHYLSYIGVRFVLVPLLFAPLGRWAVLSVFVNVVLAELLHNAHSFLCIRPSHSAPDIPLFSGSVECKHEFSLRQLLGTVNYRGGSDWLDLLHLWCNYHSEHHMWPSMPLLKYQQYHPQLVALCKKHGVLYAQQSVWARYRSMARLFVDMQDQPRIDTTKLLHPHHNQEQIHVY